MNFSNTWMRPIKSGGCVSYNHFTAVLINLSVIGFNPWGESIFALLLPHPTPPLYNLTKFSSRYWQSVEQRWSTLPCFFFSSYPLQNVFFKHLLYFRAVSETLFIRCLSALAVTTASVLTFAIWVLNLTDGRWWLRLEETNYWTVFKIWIKMLWALQNG